MSHCRIPKLCVKVSLPVILWGVTGGYNEEPMTLEELLADCAEQAKNYGFANPGDLIGVTAGLAGQRLGTNLFEVHRVL